MYPRIKRVLDLVISIPLLIVLSPLLLLLTVLIRLTSPGPALFRQKRVGNHKKYFMIYKFRTMRVDTPSECPTHLFQEPEKYITPIGGFLRAYSLDELPQLLNVIKGEMSIVGPRPALWNQFDLIEARDAVGANDVRPGMTGWAQINGRDRLPMVTKVALDAEYVRRMSFLFDLRCFLGTIFRVLRREGVVEGAQNGNEKK